MTAVPYMRLIPKRRGGSFADGSATHESASGSGGMTYALIKSYFTRCPRKTIRRKPL